MHHCSRSAYQPFFFTSSASPLLLSEVASAFPFPLPLLKAKEVEIEMSRFRFVAAEADVKTDIKAHGKESGECARKNESRDMRGVGSSEHTGRMPVPALVPSPMPIPVCVGEREEFEMPRGRGSTLFPVQAKRKKGEETIAVDEGVCPWIICSCARKDDICQSEVGTIRKYISVNKRAK